MLTQTDKSLIYSSQIKLAFLYSSLFGGILLFLGFISHQVLQVVFNQVIDRELEALSIVVEDRIKFRLKEPGYLSPADRIQVETICPAGFPCQEQLTDPLLRTLIRENYSFRLVSLTGDFIGAIGESPDRFLSKNLLKPSYTDYDRANNPYHFHRFTLRTIRGQSWGYLQVGRSIQRQNDYISGLHILIFLGIPLTMVLVGGTGWWFAGVALHPVYKSYVKMQQFTADASHELRTPIASIKAILAVATVDETSLDLKQSNFLESIQRQSDRLEKMTQDLLLLSRLESKQVLPRTESICLNTLIQDLDEEIAPLALSRNVELVSRIQSQKLLYISGNSSHIYRLFSNLITNAIQHTPAAGLVELELVYRQNYAIVTVRDNGSGIAATDLPHLFDRFYRASQDRSRETGGVGLGLAIAQSIALAHNGQVQVQSQICQGSTFTVRLPLRAVGDPA
jgi:signal transduction histidine kinase